MSWRDRFKQGSFRGIPFLVKASEGEGGHRLHVHDLIGGDVPLIEYLGRSAPAWRMQVLIFGDDYDVDAFKLQQELDKGGRGFLVHPQLGARSVQIERWRRMDSTETGSVTGFEFVAIEELFRDFPGPLGDATSGINGASDAAQSAASGSIISGLVTKFVPQFVRDAAASAVSAVTDVMKGLRFVRATGSEVSAFTEEVSNIADEANTLINAPANLAAQIIGSFQKIESVGMGLVDSLYAYRQVFGLAADVFGGSSAISRAADRNRELITDLARVAAVTGAARIAVQIRWDSEDAAIEAREAIEAEIDDLEARADDQLLQALEDLRARVRAGVPNPAIRVPKVANIVLERTFSSIYVAYRFLDDATQCDAIAAMNHVGNPLLMPGGTPLRIPQGVGVP